MRPWWMVVLGLWLVGGCVEIDPKSCEEGLPEGNPCDDGDPCTEGDLCSGGACVGSFKDCSILDSQCQFGACDPISGDCIQQNAQENSNCEDGDGCTEGETCQGGACQGGTPKECVSAGACEDGFCDIDTGECGIKPRDDDTPCDDGNACTGPGDSDVCTFNANAGSSSCGGAPIQCSLPAGLSSQCATVDCIATDFDGDPCQVSFINDGQGCNDNNPNTVGEECAQGQCTNGAPACTSTGPEPNNDTTSAQTNAVLSSGANTNSNICPADLDLFAVDLPLAGDGLAIEVRDNVGGCSFDSTLELRRNDGSALGAFVTSATTVNGVCPRIDPSQDANAQALSAGLFFPLVKGKTADDQGAYIVEVDTTADANGNINNLETEPNDTNSAADRPDFRSGSYRGRLSSTADIDIARFEVSAKSKLFAIVSNGNNGCAFDSKLELLNSAGAVITSASGGGPGGCPSIDLLLAPPAGFTDLDPGNFFLRISSENGGAGFYQLDVIFEATEHESNNNSASAEGPFNTGAIEGVMGAGGDLDFYKVTLTAPGSIFALTRGPQGANCGTTIDTQLELKDVSGVTLASDDDINPQTNRCSVISNEIAPNTASPANGGGKDLPPGTYFVVVKPFGTTTGSYRLDIVITRTSELEPNSTKATSDTIGIITAQNRGAVEARLTPSSVDLYAVTVPQGADLTAETSDGAGSCLLDTLLQIRNTNGLSTSSLATDDDSGIGLCSIATATNLPAGTYFIAVSPFINTSGVSAEGPYVLSVTITP